jgi:hypothetical protein
VTDALQLSLISALSKLNEQFRDDAESLHFAVSIVFSSVLNNHGFPCIIVGGQSAAYWMRIPGSTDVDFVSPVSKDIAIIFEQCGFRKSEQFSFRFHHPETNVLIELVGDRIEIAGIKSTETVVVEPDDIEDPLVRSLMSGPAKVIDPLLVFLNYLDASCRESIWFDFEDEGALAIERMQALLVLYEGFILNGLKTQSKTGDILEKHLKVLREKFKITL